MLSQQQADSGLSLKLHNMFISTSCFWSCSRNCNKVFIFLIDQVGNRKLMSENSITIPDHVEKFVEELEESAKTGVIVAYSGQLVGVMGVADPLKREAAVVVEGLLRMGVRPIMVTGDNWRTARAVAKEVKKMILFGSGLVGVFWFSISVWLCMSRLVLKM